MVNTGSGYSIWSVGLASGSAQATKVIATVEGAKALNGLTKTSSGLLLAADTMVGGVFAFDITKATSSLAIQDASMVGLLGLPVGINGVRARDTYLYYTSSSLGTLSRMPIDVTTGRASGPSSTVAKGLPLGIDDFSLDPSSPDAAYVMNYLGGEVLRVNMTTGENQALGKANYVTSAQFGRAAGDERTLYVTSGGNPLNQVMGLFEGGKIYSVKP